MPQWLRLCSTADLPAEGEAREIPLGERLFCAATVDGQLTVTDNECPHRGGPLGQGLIEQGRIICPWHAWAFDLRTGCALHNAKACIHLYPTRIEGGDVLIELA
uniref:Rieske (2Fe-2S) protein n=1 Tax=Acidobacterium capsulatum TaxID=33075 RepID=A0A7V5CU24_9BACT